MKRKIVSLLTMGALAISLIGCGNAQENTTAPATQENTTVSEVTTDDETPEATEEVIEEETATDAMKGFGDVAIGEYVTFGHYEQDNDYSDGKGNDPIEWLVLDHQDGRTLLIARCALKEINYNDTMGDITWETCTLRTWMNDEFYNEAFTDEEKAIIALTHNVNNDTSDELWAPYMGDYPVVTDGGNDTDDYVFCLSAQEAADYFGLVTHGSGEGFITDIVDESAMCYVTPVVNQHMHGLILNERYGFPEYYEGSCIYWLRTPGPAAQNTTAWATNYIGCEICYLGKGAGYGARPAIWVND